MRHASLIRALLASASLSVACANEPGGSLMPTGSAGTSAASGMSTGTPGAVVPDQSLPVQTTFEPTSQQTLDYMRYLGPALIGRVLSDDEETRLSMGAADAVKPIVEQWVNEPGFADAVRAMMEVRLGTNGKRGSVDFNLAGYIVRHVVKHQLPWSQILTSTTCYDALDTPIPCDTGAPYTAGVLTTRGFLAGNEGRFNLGRARATLLTFMCRDYPMEDTVQPYIEKPKLKLMFRASNAEEQQVAEVAGGFGNGLQCFMCHGQFSSHSQPFVKFDKAGSWIAQADGLQSAKGQLGEAEHDCSASHLEAPAEAASEAAQWFGTPIANLAEGAAVMAKNPRFRECAVQQLLDLGLGVDLGFDTKVKGLAVMPELLSEIAQSVADENPDPTIQELAVATYSDVRVMATTLNGLKR